MKNKSIGTPAQFESAVKSKIAELGGGADVSSATNTTHMFADPNGVLGEVAAEYSYDEIVKIWENLHEDDPSMTSYGDDFDAWWHDTHQQLQDVPYNKELEDIDSASDIEANNRYTYVKSKSVTDYDGFLTDYTMYYDTVDNRYVFVFGDTDCYTPEDGDFDYETESKEDANEWFDSYTGTDEPEDIAQDWEDNEEVFGSLHTTDAIDRDRYLHTLIGDVDAKLIGSGIAATFDQDATNLYISIDESGEEATYEIPLLDLHFDWQDLKSDVSYILDSVNGSKGDVCSATNTDADGYHYYTKHGIGPGTLPKDVSLLKSEDKDANLTCIWVNRPLTTKELNDYDIYPETENSRFEDVECADDENQDTTQDDEYIPALVSAIQEELAKEEIDSTSFNQNNDTLYATVVKDGQVIEYSIPFSDLSFSIDQIDADANYILDAIES